MRKEFIKHKLAYSILAAVLLSVIFLFFAVWPSLVLQRFLAVFLAVFYFIWGLFTHFKTETLTTKVVTEYLAVSFMAGGMLLLITY